MMSFAALVLMAVLFKLLGNQVFTPLSVVVATCCFAMRYPLDSVRRRKLEIFLLQFGVLLYALANQDPSYYEHIALVVCMLPTLTRLREVAQVAWAEGSILLVLLYVLWSICWTSNVDMSVAGYVMSALCLTFLVAFALEFKGDLHVIFGHLLTVLVAVMVGSWVVGAMGYGAAGRTFSGVTLHRNQLGFLLGLLILISLFRLRFNFRWVHVLGCLAAAGLLVYIDSKSSIISIAFTAVVLFVISARRWKIYTGLLALVIAALFAALPSPKMDNFALWVGRDPTFTSRTEIWADSVKLAADQAFTGYGYNAVWSTFENRLSQYRNAPGPLYAHAHNAWIDWVLQLGLGGLAIYILFLGVLLKRALDRTRESGGRPLAIQATCLLLYVQIYDLANVSTIPVTRIGFFVLALTSLSLWLSSSQRTVSAALPGGKVYAHTGRERVPQQASTSRTYRVTMALSLVVVGFLAMSGYAIWQDGRRYAAVDKPRLPTANGVAAASYLDAKQFQWKTAESLQEYARKHRQELRERMARSVEP